MLRNSEPQQRNERQSVFRIIENSEEFPLQPRHIHIGKGFTRFGEAFGNFETEISAYYIVRLCQVRGTWEPFTKEEIEAEYQKSGHRDFYFNRLLDRKWIVLKDGKYHITVEFVALCFKSSPALKTEPVPA